MHVVLGRNRSPSTLFLLPWGFIDWEYPGYADHSGTPQDKINWNLLVSHGVHGKLRLQLQSLMHVGFQLDNVRHALDVLGAETGRYYGLTAGKRHSALLWLGWPYKRGSGKFVGDKHTADLCNPSIPHVPTSFYLHNIAPHIIALSIYPHAKPCHV